MFLQPESGTVRLVVTGEGDVTVSQRLQLNSCAAKGLKPDWDRSGLVVLD